MSLKTVLDKYRKEAISERDKGNRFEFLMKRYLETDPLLFSWSFTNIWLWSDFPYRTQFSEKGGDTGIDLVAKTNEGEYIAVQCKCYQETAKIDKSDVDTFLSTSGKSFSDENGKLKRFSYRLWLSTTDLWTSNAEETLKNQMPPVQRIGLLQLEESATDWDKLDSGASGSKAKKDKKKLFQHQADAIKSVHEYFKNNNRGKLIMACGTGKTFTSLKIAEKETDNKGTILFLVPSIALLGQTLREWTSEAEKPINPICVCSDSTVSRTSLKDDDSGDISVTDLALPATTNTNEIIKQFNKILKKTNKGMTVVFSTYQSIEAVSAAQKRMNARKKDSLVFDLVICDEAHRTTGVILNKKSEAAFTKVHDNTIIKARKRMYMTATPRLYRDDVKDKAKEKEVLLCSMDDEDIYGQEMYRIGFGEAVEKQLLSDYKVLVLTLPGKNKAEYKSEGLEIGADEEEKLIGCINALSKRTVTRIMDGTSINELTVTDPGFMHKAVAFCPTIKESKEKAIELKAISKVYKKKLPQKEEEDVVLLDARHVDGSMGATTRDDHLRWLKSAPEDGSECRILTNVRCLSEGVDVPSLDAVIFLSAKNSQVDVVQSVGRVMRRADGKKYGYIIIPVVIPYGAKPEDVLEKSDKFNVVWTVLKALRAHDDRFNAEINKIELNKKPRKYPPPPPPPVIIVTDKEMEEQMLLKFEEFTDTFYAKMVQKVGNRHYWEQWASDIAGIADRHIKHITKVIKDNPKHEEEFDKFLKGLQKQLNPSITKEEAIEMLSQHLITRPVFEALFENYTFAEKNPVSQSMQKMIDILDENQGASDKEQQKTLSKFYESVRERVEGIENAEGRQRVIIELYDKFFRTALPLTVEKLGIVYTPVEVVDFIINSIADILKKEFARSLSDENIHILDPFTGTGTFITRLLQSGHIKPEDICRKYKKEIHANEIVLLAYYIASINIENTYHGIIEAKEDKYESFDGICLTDTFQSSEDDNDSLLSEIFHKNSERVEKQKKCPLTVILGNPPYSVGQKSENDNAKNQKYKKLDKRVADTYATNSTAVLKNSLYDSYIKSFRWASDRLDMNGGVIGFVTNGGWLDTRAMDGFRKCLEEEFTSIYVFNLRGNQRTQGELSKKEGGKIFGSGSRTPVAITLLVKNPAKKKAKAEIFYRDIGDYLSREDKLKILSQFKSVLSPTFKTEKIKPNEHHDWLNKRSDIFEKFVPIGDKKETEIETCVFSIYSRGIITDRDAWCYNYSRSQLLSNMSNTINFYNAERKRYSNIINKPKQIEDFISVDLKKISWSSALKNNLAKNRKINLTEENIYKSLYRPFCSQFAYIDKYMNERRYQMPKLFPTPNHENLCICVSSQKDDNPLITNCIADLHFNGDSQCFPLYWYEKNEEVDEKQGKLFTFDTQSKNEEYIRHDGITDFAFKIAHRRYGYKTTKENIFYYVYGLLHSKDYRTKFASDLKKMLPRIPFVDSEEDFFSFSKAGKELAKLHLNYEKQNKLSCVKVTGEESKNFKVDKIRFKSKEDKSEIMFNSSISITGIPNEAHDYSVNGRTPIEWILERYQIKTDKDSQITNDPNDWATEHENPRYILDLLLSVITMSVETVKIIDSLPKIDFEKLGEKDLEG